jgi:UDP-N-acetylmuramate--alanine ligase
MTKYYFVGIKGIAMAALSIIAKERGDLVGGSDIPEAFPSDSELKQHGIAVDAGFKTAAVESFSPQTVIYTGAHGGMDNPQVQWAVAHGIPAVAHGRALGDFMKPYRQVSVSGCHGKTTTSAMIAFLCTKAGTDASYAVGTGEINGLGSAGHAGRGEWFIAEADEYLTDPGHDLTPRFLWQHPELLLITNIDYDHPDAYSDISQVQDAYRKFIGNRTQDGWVIANGDDQNSKEVLPATRCIRIGTANTNDYAITDIKVSDQSISFELHGENGIIPLQISVPGLHNVYNAAFASVAAHRMGVPWSIIRDGLVRFTGSKRRFELIENARGMAFYDDYAHHPIEISSTLSAAKGWFPGRRIICVFQPHTYSRTHSLMADFSVCFSDADIILITDIYASARERNDLGFSGSILADAVSKHHPEVHYAKTPGMVSEILRKICDSGDVILFMGAGDIYTWSRDVVVRLAEGRI